VLQAALAAAGKDNTVKVTESISSNGLDVRMSGAQQFSPLRISQDVTMSAGAPTAGLPALSEIYDGTNLYLKAPQMSTVDGGKPWALVDPVRAASAGNSIQSLLGGAQEETPNSSIAPLLASVDLRSLGAGSVDGVRATQYSGTLDAAQVSSMSPADGLTADQVQQIKQSFQRDSVSSETVYVWIDSDNLPVRQGSLVTTDIGTITTTIDYSDWGTAVSITDPPADEIGALDSSAY